MANLFQIFSIPAAALGGLIVRDLALKNAPDPTGTWVLAFYTACVLGAFLSSFAFYALGTWIQEHDNKAVRKVPITTGRSDLKQNSP